MNKQATINQLTLGVGLKDEATFINYYPLGNELLLNELKKMLAKQGERFLFISGTGGQGRTHLLQACCHEANRQNIRSVYIPLQNISDFSVDILEGLETLSLVCIDDFHKIAGNPLWEEAFFHSFNRIRDSGTSLVITANTLPNTLGLTMPDVLSRLNWGIVFQLQQLNDEDKLTVLKMRASRRGLTLNEEVGKFILTHCPRHMSTLFAALDALDKASLAAQRKLTIPFVKDILEI